MKHLLPALFVLSVLCCNAQDTNKHISRNSVSFSGGVNVVYPVTKQLTSNTAEGPNAIWDLPIWDLTITPTSSASSYFSLTYNYRFYHRMHHYFSLHAGFTYLQYCYKMNAHGYFLSNGYDSGTFKAQSTINAAELNAGISMDYYITKHISWHNEFDITEGYYNNSAIVFTTDAPASAPFNDVINPDGYFFINNTYTYLFYKTGFNIELSQHISIMPEFSIPLFNILYLLQNSEPYPYQLPIFSGDGLNPIYRSLRTGVTLTYNFNRK